MDAKEMHEAVLAHHGIKGMKWGVRRYQNADGSLTPAGKKRQERDRRELSDDKKKNYEADPNKWVKEDLGRSRRLTDETATLSNKLKSMNDSSMRNRKKATMDLSNMTDQQMRNEINRRLLERQYNDLFAPQKVSRGREVAGKIFEGAAATLGIASSALGIALAIKELKG
jgi:hypothetical protein